MMKTKISVILLGLGLASASAYAGTVAEPMPVSNDINLTAPDQSGMWSFGIMAVLMQPTNKDFTYAGSNNDTANANTNTEYSNFDHPSVGEGYDWWFAADISYAFPGNGRDVTLAYEGLHGTDSAHTSTAELGTLFSSFSGTAFLTAEGKTDTSYDAGDLVFGQKIDVGQRMRLHPFMGVRYAYIDTDDTASYTGGQHQVNGGAAVFDQSQTAKIENTFNGIGPRLGSDAEVDLGQGFSIRGRFGLSVLIGSHNLDAGGVDTDYNPDGTVASTDFISVADNKSETQVIPEIDGRLGLHYTCNFDSTTALGFELGWQATNYFNAISDQPTLTDTIPLGPEGNGIPSYHYDDTSSFGVQGPYARIQLDVA